MNEIQNKNINSQQNNKSNNISSNNKQKSSLRTGFILSIIGAAMQMVLMVVIILFFLLLKSSPSTDIDTEQVITVLIAAIGIISILMSPVWIAIIVLATKNLNSPDDLKACLAIGILSIIFGGILGIVGGILILVDYKN